MVAQLDLQLALTLPGVAAWMRSFTSSAYLAPSSPKGPRYGSGFSAWCTPKPWVGVGKNNWLFVFCLPSMGVGHQLGEQVAEYVLAAACRSIAWQEVKDMHTLMLPTSNKATMHVPPHLTPAQSNPEPG